MPILKFLSVFDWPTENFVFYVAIILLEFGRRPSGVWDF